MLSLSGDMEVPQIASPVFSGALRISENEASFKVRIEGSIQDPLGMFGVKIKKPELYVAYQFQDGVRSGSRVLISGEVEFHGLCSRPPLVLTGKCIWADGFVAVVDIELKTSRNPLTLSSLVATIYDVSWDSDLIDLDYTMAGYLAHTEWLKWMEFPMNQGIASPARPFSSKRILLFSLMLRSSSLDSLFLAHQHSHCI